MLAVVRSTAPRQQALGSSTSFCLAQLFTYAERENFDNMLLPSSVRMSFPRLMRKCESHGCATIGVKSLIGGSCDFMQRSQKSCFTLTHTRTHLPTVFYKLVMQVRCIAPVRTFCLHARCRCDVDIAILVCTRAQDTRQAGANCGELGAWLGSTSRATVFFA